jgi:DNA-binding transcriptional MerR regulator
MKKHFTIQEAADLAGFKTQAMVGYLCREGIITPSGRANPGRGRPRLFSFKDVLILRTIQALLSAGLSVKKLSKAIQSSEDLNNLTADMSQMICEGNPIQFFITDGENIYLRIGREELIDLSHGKQMAFTFMLDLGPLHDELADKVRHLYSNAA